MENYNSSRGLIQQMLRTRMAFRQALQRVLKRNNIDITFEMLQVLSSLWQEQGISQQALAEKTAKDKACMTNLMANLEKKGWIMRRKTLTTVVTDLCTSLPQEKRYPTVYARSSRIFIPRRAN